MSRPVKVRILDEVYIAIVGLRDTDLNYFYQEYAKFAPNYFFHPKFKVGQWDGKIRFFEKTGRTFLYLIEEILPKLQAMGYSVSLEDLRADAVPSPNLIDNKIFEHILHQIEGTPIILRDYQCDGVNSLIQHGYGIIKAATGAGKTLITSAIATAYGSLGLKSITIVPSDDLVVGTVAEYRNCMVDTGIYSGTSKDLDHQHIVSTWQALKNNPALMMMFDVVIVDECHGAKGPVLNELLLKYAAHIPFRFGVTGTLPPEPSDEMSVLTALGPVRYEISARTLIDAGVLADIHIDVVNLEEDLTEQYQAFINELSPLDTKPTYLQFKDGYFPDFSAEKSYLCRNDMRIEWIAHMISAKRDQGKGNILCLVDSIPLGRELAALVPGSMFVNGKDVKKTSDRQKIYKLFQTSDDLVVFATVHIAGTGINIPRVFTMYFVDVGKSFIRVIQGIGRGLRKAHDKDRVEIIDVCSDLKYGKKHMNARIKIYKDAQYPYKKHKINYKKFFSEDQ